MIVLVLVAVVVVAIAAHEGAHAAATRLVGHELFEVQIGAGPITGFTAGTVRVRVGPLPIGGSVQTGSPDPRGFRWRTACIAAAGPSANLVLAGACAVAGIGPGVVFNLVAAGANLWPGSRRRLGEPASDGRVLVDVVRGDPSAMAEERATWWAATALRQREAGQDAAARATVEAGLREVGPAPSLLVVAGLLAFAEQRFTDAVQAYAPLIDDEAVTVQARAGVAADAAWAASLSDDPELRRLAAPWALLGVRVAPRDSHRRMVHALALVDAGDPAGSLQAMEGIDGPVAAGVRTVALAAAGRRAEAAVHRDAEVSGRLASDHPVLARVTEALGT